jgi:hypothetical protein
VRNHHELGECRPPKERVVCHLEISYPELHVLSSNVLSCPEGHEKSDLPDGATAALGTILWKGARLGHSAHLDNPIWLKVFKNRMFRELPPSIRTRLSLMSLMMELTIRGYGPDFVIKSGWSLQSKVMETSSHFRYSGVAGDTAMTSWVVSFCFLLES